MSQKDKSITIKLTFTEDDLNAVLKAAHFGDGKPLTVKKVIKAKRFKELEKEFKDTAQNFVWEIVDGSRDACANDWLGNFDNGE